MVTAAELQNISFFAPINELQLTTLLQDHRLLRLPQGQILITEADWGEFVIVLLEGLAKVRSFNGDGEEIVYALLGAGDLIGEIAVLEGDTRSADVIGLSSTKILKIPGRAFLALIKSGHEPALSLARLESQRLRNLNQRFGLQRSNATSRLLFTLAYIASKSNMEGNPLEHIPPISQAEIACIAGMARETTSRTMSKLRAKGDVVEVAGQLKLASLNPLTKRGIWP